MVTFLGSLVQLCCGEGGTVQTNTTGVCGECSQCLGHTEFAAAHGMCAFMVYTAQALGCSVGEVSKAGPGSRALPRSKPLRFRFSGTPQRHRLSWTCVLCPSRSKQVRRPGAWRMHSPQVGWCLLSLPRSWLLVSQVCSGNAISGVLCVFSGELISG